MKLDRHARQLQHAHAMRSPRAMDLARRVAVRPNWQPMGSTRPRMSPFESFRSVIAPACSVGFVTCLWTRRRR